MKETIPVFRNRKIRERWDIVAQKKVKEKKEKEFHHLEESLQNINPEKFWEELGRVIREGIRIALEKAISYEFRRFIEALEYERTPNRRDHRNGYRKRDFETVYGPLENIKIPRARCSSFTPWVIPRFERRESRIGHLISRIHLLVFQQGISRRYQNTYMEKPIHQVLYQGSIRSLGRLSLYGKKDPLRRR